MVRSCGDACFYVYLQTWLHPKTNSPTMSFLNENDSLAYFEIIVRSVFNRGLFQGLFDFSSSLVGFFGGPGSTSQHPNVLVGLRKPSNLGQGSCQACSVQKCVYVQNRCHFCQKSGRNLANLVIWLVD